MTFMHIQHLVTSKVRIWWGVNQLSCMGLIYWR